VVGIDLPDYRPPMGKKPSRQMQLAALAQPAPVRARGPKSKKAPSPKRPWVPVVVLPPAAVLRAAAERAMLRVCIDAMKAARAA